MLLCEVFAPVPKPKAAVVPALSPLYDVFV
jgi:hypothetical protein